MDRLQNALEECRVDLEKLDATDISEQLEADCAEFKVKRAEELQNELEANRNAIKSDIAVLARIIAREEAKIAAEAVPEIDEAPAEPIEAEEV